MEVVFTEQFKKTLKTLTRRYRSIRQDIEPAIDELLAGDTPGDQIGGVGYTVYKVRLKNTDAQRGKSGGYRMIYYIKTPEQVALIALYSKSDQDDIPDDEVRALVEDYLAGL